LSSGRTSYALCPQKAKLLDDYVAALNIYYVDVHEYSEMLRNRINGDSLVTVKERMQENRDRTESARKRYAAHLEEHRCDSAL
jgi:hypothetical protein